MCLIACKPAGVFIPKKYLRNGFRENGHGSGYMVAKDGELIIKKGFFSFLKILATANATSTAKEEKK